MSLRFKPLLPLLGLTVLYFWSLGGGATQVRIEVRGDLYSLFLDGKEISSTRIDAWQTGGIGYRQHGKAVPLIPSYQGLESLSVTDLDSGEVILLERFDDAPLLNGGRWATIKGTWWFEGHSLTSLDRPASLMTAGTEWGDYALEAQVSNLLGADFYLRVQNEDNYVGLFVRPFRDKDGTFYLVRDNKRVWSGKTWTPLLSPIETLKRSLGLVLHYLPQFLIFFGVISLLAIMLLYGLERFTGSSRRSVSPGSDKRSRWRNSNTVVFGLMLVLMAVNFCWLSYVTLTYLDGIPHVQDSATAVFQAKMLSTGRLSVDVPASLRSFILDGFMRVREDRLFGIYPFGYPLFLVPGVIFDALWVMPAVAGTLLLFTVFSVGRLLLTPAWGLMAAFLLFCSPFYQMMAPNFMSHTVAALYFAISFFFFIQIESCRGYLYPVLGGVFMGLLFNTRPMTAAAVGLAFGLFAVATLLKNPDRRRLIIQYCRFGLPVLAFLGIACLYNYHLMGHPFTSTYGSVADSVFEDLLSWQRASRALLDHFTLSSLFLMVVLGWSAVATVIPGLGIFLPGPPRKHAWLALTCMVFVFAGYMAYRQSAVTVMYGPRYAFELSWIFIVLYLVGLRRIVSGACRTSCWAVSRLSSEGVFSDSRRKVKQVLSFGLLICLLTMGSSRLLDWIKSTHQPWPGNAYVPQNLRELKGFNHTSPIVQGLVKQEKISNAVVFVEGPRYQWWNFGSVYAENGPDFDTDIVYARDLGGEANLKVISLFPGRRYYLANYAEKTIREIHRGELVTPTSTPQQ